MFITIIIIILIILIIIKFFKNYENFKSCHKIDECSKYGNNYNACYNSGHCTIMDDLAGNAFCTSKFA